jgi:phosphoglycolate phosphatase
VRVLCAIFDLDGTLVDSLEDLATALNQALVDHGLPRAPLETVRTWIGGGARTLVAHAVAASQVDPSRVDGVLARFRVHYAAAPIVKTRLYPGIAEMLEQFVEAGVRLAVLTNKPHDLAVRICGPLLAPWPFGAIIGQREGVALKPDPRAALEIAEDLGVEPARCVFIGDSDVDIETAHAAGMRAVGVSWGFRPRAELERARPSLIVHEPVGLTQLLDPIAG